MPDRFPDGDEIAIDPRGDDPLVYYLPRGDWQRALAIELDPLYGAKESQAVTLRPWDSHAARFQAREDAELREIFERVIRHLSGHYPQLKQLTLDLPSWATARLGAEALDSPLRALGWQQSTTADNWVWTR